MSPDDEGDNNNNNITPHDDYNIRPRNSGALSNKTFELNLEDGYNVNI